MENRQQGTKKKSGLDLDLYHPHVCLLRLFDACKPSLSVLRCIRSHLLQVDESIFNAKRHPSANTGDSGESHDAPGHEACPDLVVSHQCQDNCPAPSLLVNSGSKRETSKTWKHRGETVVQSRPCVLGPRYIAALSNCDLRPGSDGASMGKRVTV